MHTISFGLMYWLTHGAAFCASRIWAVQSVVRADPSQAGLLPGGQYWSSAGAAAQHKSAELQTASVPPWALMEGCSCRWRTPWAHPELCPFNVGPHWLGGYQEVNTGLALAQQPSKGQQRSGSPWIASLNHCIRSFPSAKASAQLAWGKLSSWDGFDAFESVSRLIH